MPRSSMRFAHLKKACAQLTLCHPESFVLRPSTAAQDDKTAAQDDKTAAQDDKAAAQDDKTALGTGSVEGSSVTLTFVPPVSEGGEEPKDRAIQHETHDRARCVTLPHDAP